MEPPQRDQRILVVEDDRSLGTLIGRKLRSEGFECAVVARCNEAKVWLESHRADLILLGTDLHGECEWKLARELASEAIAVPFIVVTGRGEARLAAEMLKYGARDYLIEDHELLSLLVPVVERVLGQKERERRLSEAEKALGERESLARLGEMAAVVAHEVKNPLAAISGAIQVIGRQLPPESVHASIIEEILDRIDNLNETVNDLLFFARPRSPRLAPVPILSLLEDTIVLLEQDPDFGAIEVRAEGEDVLIEGDAELLKRTFQNFLVNSAQAMGGKGSIHVGVEEREKSYRITVTDSGPGIPREIRSKIFEPFVSSKARGTGLGLPTARRIVEAHGGTISVDCPESGGTVVTVDMPRDGKGATG